MARIKNFLGQTECTPHFGRIKAAGLWKSSMRKPKKHLYSLRSYALFLKAYRKGFFLTAIAFLFSSLAISLVPFFLGQLVQATATPNQPDTIMLYVWILVILSSGHDLLWRAGELLHRHFINPLRFEYETQLFQHVINKPYPYFVDKFSGKISSNITLLYRELQGLLADIFYAYISQIVSLVTLAVIMASVNWQTFLIFIGGIIGMMVVGRHTLKNSGKYESISTDRESTKNGIIIDSIANFASVKSFHKEHTEFTSVKQAQDEALKTAQTSYTWAIVFWASMSLFVRHLIWPIAILLNVHLFLQGAVTIGQLTTLLSAILLFASTVWEMVWYTSQFNLRFARTEEAHRYLFGEVTFRGTQAKLLMPSAPEPSFTKSLELTQVSFAYPDKPERNVLHAINLRIKKGEKIGVVGRSGGGKTTLVKLLLDYYKIPEGHIYIDEKPATTQEIARSIAYVPQDTSLFHRSIADNIAYAAQNTVTREAVIKAAKQAHAHEFIMEIEGGYDALVGERGVKLSGGQRQRIAIARAILRDAPILVLDEATSALDSENELLIQDALWKLMENRTAIVIAHRLSTIQKMDRIIVLDGGKIIEEGSHMALLQKKGKYAELWSHQSGGFIEE
jgi:ABC-type multidrug transport system fused ATPase/permease subunit